MISFIVVRRIKLSESIKYKLFYFVRYFGDAFFYPFMTMYFISKGITEGGLGIILAITPITTILVNPFWNFFIKDLKISRLVLKIMTLLEGIFIILITNVSGFELYALIVGLIAFFCSPFISLQDAYASTYANINQIEFSSLRIYASIAYAIASSIAGLMIQHWGYTVPFILSGSFFMFTTLIAFWIKPIEKNNLIVNKKERDLKSLFHNKDFFKYLAFYTVVIGAVRIGESFFGVFITETTTLDLAGYGLLYTGFVSVEVITLRYLTIKGFLYKPRNLMLLASLLYILRFLAYVFNLPIGILIAVSMLRGVSWGIVLYTHIKYVIQIVKIENITSAVLIITLSFSIFIAIGNFFFGQFINVIGYNYLYLVVLILIVLGSLIFIFFPPQCTYNLDRVE